MAPSENEFDTLVVTKAKTKLFCVLIFQTVKLEKGDTAMGMFKIPRSKPDLDLNPYSSTWMLRQATPVEITMLIRR